MNMRTPNISPFIATLYTGLLDFATPKNVASLHSSVRLQNFSDFTAISTETDLLVAIAISATRVIEYGGRN